MRAYAPGSDAPAVVARRRAGSRLAPSRERGAPPPRRGRRPPHGEGRPGPRRSLEEGGLGGAAVDARAPRPAAGARADARADEGPEGKGRRRAEDEVSRAEDGRPARSAPGADAAREAHGPFAERLLFRQERDDEERLAGEIEEVAGVDEEVLLREEAEDERFLGLDRRKPQDGGPAGRKRRDRRLGRAPRELSASAAWFERRRARRAPAASSPHARSPGSASWTGVATERYESAIQASRSSASARSGAGPFARIHPSFSCGSAAAFERPPREKTSASPAASVCRGDAHVAGPVLEAVVEEDLVGDDREAPPSRRATRARRARRGRSTCRWGCSGSRRPPRRPAARPRRRGRPPPRRGSRGRPSGPRREGGSGRARPPRARPGRRGAGSSEPARGRRLPARRGA